MSFHHWHINPSDTQPSLHTERYLLWFSLVLTLALSVLPFDLAAGLFCSSGVDFPICLPVYVFVLLPWICVPVSPACHSGYSLCPVPSVMFAWFMLHYLTYSLVCIDPSLLVLTLINT